MYQELRKYISNTGFKMIYTNNCLNVVNYSKIVILEDDKIEILISDRMLKIKGLSLKLKRIMDSELLVEGIINSLELINI